jgi:hypothetical protein
MVELVRPPERRQGKDPRRLEDHHPYEYPGNNPDAAERRRAPG